MFTTVLLDIISYFVGWNGCLCFSRSLFMIRLFSIGLPEMSRIGGFGRSKSLLLDGSSNMDLRLLSRKNWSLSLLGLSGLFFKFFVGGSLSYLLFLIEWFFSISFQVSLLLCRILVFCLVLTLRSMISSLSLMPSS